MNFNSLHVKVSVSVAAAALFVVVLSSYFFYHRAYDSSLVDSRNSVRQLLETVQITASIAAYVGNAELARQVVDGLVINDIVVASRLSGEGRVLSQEGAIDTADESSLMLLALTAPFDEQELVGELVVLPNRSLIVERARSSAVATTIGLAAQAAVIALLVLFLVYWLMTQPLSRLSGGLHRITPGDGNRVDVADLNRRDEIGTLADDINALLGAVEEMLEEERALRRRVEILEHRFRGIFEDSSAGIFLISDSSTLITANPAFFQVAELSDHILDAANGINIVEEIFADSTKVQSLINEALSSGQPCASDLRVLCANENTEKWVHCIFSPAGSEQNSAAIEGVMYDITQRKIDEAHTRELAETDSLTGLANRQVLDSALDRLVRQHGGSGDGFIVMMIDLDGFKLVNDTHGHNAGDEILKAVACRLRSLVRDSDLVARPGGDEFVIVLRNTRSIDTASYIAQRIVETQQVPIEIESGVNELVGISIGIAIYPEHGDNVDSLRKHADQAMYSVKRQGKNNYAVYTPTE